VKLLLDTCAFLWFETASVELSRAARAAIEDAENDVYLSAVSVWEIGRKFAAGSLVLSSPPEVLIPRVREESRIESLAFTEPDALMVEKLPRLHKDPFDRMLIAQALVSGMRVVTSDAAFSAYPVQILW
jgi:PIN domain nuclease of toxin-antitoxin system